MRGAFSLFIVVFPLTIVVSGCTKEKPPSKTVTETIVSESKTHQASGPTISPAPAALTTTTSPVVAKPKQPLQLTKENLIGSWAYKRFDGKEYCYADFSANKVKLKLKDAFFTVETELPYVIDKDGKARLDLNPDGTLTRGYVWFGPRDELCIIFYVSGQKVRDTSNLRPDFTLGRVE